MAILVYPLFSVNPGLVSVWDGSDGERVVVSGGEFVGDGENGYQHLLFNGVGLGVEGVGAGPCFLVALQIVELIRERGS